MAMENTRTARTALTAKQANDEIAALGSRGKGAQSPTSPVSAQAPQARSLADYKASDTPRITTGLSEIDRVLGGGLVPGGVVLIGGHPGIGKSTLLAQVLAKVCAGAVGTALYATGEEAFEQVAMRAERLGVQSPRVHLMVSNDVDDAIAEAERAPRIVAVFDSLQAMHSKAIDGAQGRVAQVSECAQRINAYAKRTSTPCIVICHINKAGDLAGPKSVEHWVDVVIEIELAADGVRRLVSSSKNRFGAADEIGVVEMTARGLIDSPRDDGSLAERAVGRPGSAVACISTGSRVSLVEVQALCSPSRSEAGGKLNCVGVDPKRAAMLMAILTEHAGLDPMAKDVFLSVTGGVQMRDPSSDAAFAVAVASALRKAAVDPATIVIGEIGLSGELRSAPGMRQRLLEAMRGGFTRAIVAMGAIIPDDINHDALTVIKAGGIEDAIALAIPPQASAQ